MPQTTITISSECDSFAKKYAKETGRTKSGLIEWLIKQFKEKQTKEFIRK